MGLQRPPALDRGAEALGIEARGRQAGVAGPVLDESVGDANLQQRDGEALGGEQLGDRGAGAALDGVFLERDEGAVAPGELRRSGRVRAVMDLLVEVWAANEARLAGGDERERGRGRIRR